jgi:hypothetical protein
MPRGTPLSLKCPKCHRGQYGYSRPNKGVKATGRVEARMSRSRHSGFGSGGCGFYGHRGEVVCLDCEHFWFSTHPRSGALSHWSATHGTEDEKARAAALPRVRVAGEGLSAAPRE